MCRFFKKNEKNILPGQQFFHTVFTVHKNMILYLFTTYSESDPIYFETNVIVNKKIMQQTFT